MHGHVQAYLDLNKLTWTCSSLIEHILACLGKAQAYLGQAQACLDMFKITWKYSSLLGHIQAWLDIFKLDWTYSSLIGHVLVCFFLDKVSTSLIGQAQTWLDNHKIISATLKFPEQAWQLDKFKVALKSSSSCLLYQAQACFDKLNLALKTSILL